MILGCGGGDFVRKFSPHFLGLADGVCDEVCPCKVGACARLWGVGWVAWAGVWDWGLRHFLLDLRPFLSGCFRVEVEAWVAWCGVEACQALHPGAAHAPVFTTVGVGSPPTAIAPPRSALRCNPLNFPCRNHTTSRSGDASPCVGGHRARCPTCSPGASASVSVCVFCLPIGRETQLYLPQFCIEPSASLSAAERSMAAATSPLACASVRRRVRRRVDAGQLYMAMKVEVWGHEKLRRNACKLCIQAWTRMCAHVAGFLNKIMQVYHPTPPRHGLELTNLVTTLVHKPSQTFFPLPSALLPPIPLGQARCTRAFSYSGCSPFSPALLAVLSGSGCLMLLVLFCVLFVRLMLLVSCFFCWVWMVVGGWGWARDLPLVPCVFPGVGHENLCPNC